MDALQLARWRLETLGLTGARFDTPEAVVGWLLAVQSQDFGPAVWAVGQRLEDGTAEVVEDSFAAGRILRTHVLRPTWHFVSPDDIRWLLNLTGPRVHALNAGIYRQEGLDMEMRRRTETIIRRALEGGGELTRGEIAERLATEGIEAARLRLAYIVMHAELEGLICSGAMRGKQHTYGLLDERAPLGRAVSREEALIELTRRYFTSHGPATVKDCARWASLTLADVRAGLEGASPDLENVVVDGAEYWVAAGEPSRGVPRVQLLQGYDEYIVGYTESKWLLNLSGRAATMGSRPVANGVVLAGTQVAGHWKRAMARTSVNFEIALYEPLDRAGAEALRSAVDRHGKFLSRKADFTVRTI
ncbi:MAG TPA: winged helix DNA-binding domain-containing protein [Acidimicrobiia bacterium]|nr:winged helix DNA-binding domain-containing protein [Acidimicrobiia bacterium]